MKKIAASLLAIFLVTAAHAQSVQQSGNVTPGHAVRWITNGIIGDAGSAANGSLTSLGVTASGTGICQNSGPITSAYNSLCLGVTSTGGTISLTNYGGATGGLTISGATFSSPTINDLTVTGSFTATGLVTNDDLAGSIAASKLIGTDIDTVGTITTGTWHGTAIEAAYLPTATSLVKGIVQGDGSTLTITAGTISCTTATTLQIGCSKPDGTTITISGGALTAIGAAATSIAVGTTTISGGTSGYLFYDNAGVLGKEAQATLAQGGTGADLSATGGTGQIVQQATAGGAFTVGALASSALPAPFTSGSASGNTSSFATTTGTLTSGNCAQWDANGNLIATGAACSSISATAYLNAALATPGGTL